MPDSAAAVSRRENSIVETLQSLIVAFVLAMTFRGFVTEGFVIPTGSMAPTLLGQHMDIHSPETGYDFTVGFDERWGRNQITNAYEQLADPMLGRSEFGSASSRNGSPRVRMGDRILVLKSLYPFVSPARFDVVVFKNPTNPNGEDGNYIKRLIGLPGEAIWLVDGDVFAAPADAADDFEMFRIQRKPEYVQRAVWQPVYDSDYIPTTAHGREQFYRGSPWIGSDEWQTAGRSFSCGTADETHLEWDSHRLQITDWEPYNMLSSSYRRFIEEPDNPVSDLRVDATVVPDQDGLHMTFELSTRNHVFEYTIGGGTARVRMRSKVYGDEYPDQGWIDEQAPVEVDPFEPGKPTNVEFWHVDQSVSIFIDGERVAHQEYDWRPEERLQNSVGRPVEVEEIIGRTAANPPSIMWRFSGSPLEIHRLRLDRDLYYRIDKLNEYTRKNPTNKGFERIVAQGEFAFGTHPRNLAILGDDHFFMLGDNSSASSDSRMWGNPHPVVAEQIDEAPFLVNRKLLLGKAWVVYFPAPLPISPRGKAFIPDFGSLRFIR